MYGMHFSVCIKTVKKLVMVKRKTILKKTA